MRDLRAESVESADLGAGAAAEVASGSGEVFVLQDEGTASGLGAAILHATRRGAERLVLFVDEHAGVVARLASYFTYPVEVRRVVDAGSEAAAPDPMPVVPPGPDEADGVEPLLAQLRDRGLEVVLEDGTWRGELLGLEVARVVRWPEETGGDGELHIEAGVGRFDRDAVAAMHGGEDPGTGLDRAVEVVSARRHRGAGTHPLTLLARARWLRADALAEPALVGAGALTAVQTAVPATSVRDEVPCAALGTSVDGSPVVVVFASGAGLDVVPVAAETRALHAPAAGLRIAVVARDRLAPLDTLAGLLAEPAEVVTVPAGWA